jgi:hypothetical protein
MTGLESKEANVDGNGFGVELNGTGRVRRKEQRTEMDD